MSETKRGLSTIDIALLGAAFVWGASYLTSRELTHYASLWGMMALRFGIAGVILYFFRFKNFSKFTKPEVIAGLGIATTLVMVMSVETTGIYFTSATNSGLIISLSILFTPILEGAVRKFWMPRQFYLAALGAIIGVGLLVSGNGFQEPNIGDAIMIGAAVLRAVHTVAQGYFTHGKQKMDTVNVTVLQLLFAGLAFFVIDAPGTINAATTYGGREWFMLGVLVLLCTVYGFIVMLWGIRRTSASRVALLQGTEPVWAVIIAVIFGGENMTWMSVIGAAVIISACYWGLSIENKAREDRNVSLNA